MKSDKKALSASQLLIALIMIAVVVWAVSLIVSKAVFDTISFNNRLISRKRAVDSTLSVNLEAVDELKAKFDQVEAIGPGAARVLRALPDKADIPSLVSKLEALLAASGVSFDRFSLSGASDSQNTSTTDDGTTSSVATTPQELTFSIQVSGSYASLLTVLENLEHEISPMRVSKLEIGGTISEASATIDIITYYQDRISTDFTTETLQ